jgi:hypothetical protein
MDTQNLPYRVKSARRKRRLVIKDRDKQLLKLDRERQSISKDPEYKTVVPLDKPYQKGWKRLFVLKSEIQRSDKAAFYQGIVDEINEVQYHYDQSFKRPKRKGIWHKYIFKELPKLHGVSPYHWQANRSRLNDHQRACFTKVEYWNQHYYRWEHHYEFTQPGLFEVAVLPNMVNTITIGDALLAQRVAWIDDHIQNNYLYARLDKLKDGNRYNGWKNGTEKSKYLNPLKNRPKWDWVEEQ